MQDIYRREPNYERELNRLESGSINQENKEHILKYHKHLFSEGVSKNRVIKVSGELRRIAILLKKDFLNTNEEDIRSLIVDINKLQGVRDGCPLSEMTKVDYKKTIKRFYKWLEGNNRRYPEKVDWIRGKEKINGKEGMDILTPKDIKKAISCCVTPRDKALVSLLYEGGFRIGEILGMKIRDFKNEQKYGKIRVTGKTGPREVLIVQSIPYLNQYLSFHPSRDNPESYFWLKKSDSVLPKRLMYYGARALIQRLFTRAGISKKRLYLHLFRHSRATELAKYLTEAQMKTYFGWTQGSNMASVYVHLSGRDIDNSMLGYYGLSSLQRSKERVNKNVNCSRCNTLNPANSKFCSQCGLVLELEEFIGAENEIREKDLDNSQLFMKIAKNPELRQASDILERN